MSRVAWVTLSLTATLAAAGALAPTAAAQELGTTSVDLTLPNLGAPVKPGDPQNNSVTVRYQWNNGMSEQNTTVQLSVVDEPPWLNSSFHPETVEFSTATQGPQGVKTRIVNLTLDVARDAPSYAEGTATYEAVAEENGVLQSSTVETDFAVTAGLAGRIDASLPEGTNVTAWGGLVKNVPIQVDNTANGDLLLEFSVVREPADAEIEAPDDVEVPANGGTVAPEVDVRTPWSLSLSGSVVIEVSASHLQRGTPLNTQEVEFQLEGNSAVPVPGPGPWAILGVVGAALLLRRTR